MLLAMLFFMISNAPLKAQNVEIFTSSITVAEEASFCVDIQANGFVDIAGMQLSMHWNPDIIRFDSIENYNLPFGDGNDFGYPNPSTIGLGTLTMSLANFDFEAVNLPDSTSIFQLCFTAIGEGTTGVTIDGDPTAIEIFDFNENELNVIVGASVITVGMPMALVWPGDTNMDEVVDHFDLLNVGLAFGQTGPARENAAITWEAQPAQEWDSETPISVVNFNYADTDGNGIIDANDTLAIVQNWGEETDFQEEDEDRFAGNPEAGLLNAVPPIFIQTDTLAPGEMGDFDIVLGDDANLAEDIFGLAFSITYDASVVVENSVAINFADSWLGEIGATILGLHRDNYSGGRIDIAVTRINGQNISGQGKIGSLKLLIDDALPSGQDYTLVFDIQNVRLINVSEEEIEAAPASTISLISDEMTNSNSVLLKRAIKVYPNPTTNQIFIESHQIPIEQIKLYSIEGQLLQLQQENTFTVDLSNYPEGVYLLQLVTAQGVVNYKQLKNQ